MLQEEAASLEYSNISENNAKLRVKLFSVCILRSTYFHLLRSLISLYFPQLVTSKTLFLQLRIQYKRSYLLSPAETQVISYLIHLLYLFNSSNLHLKNL